MTSIDVNLLWGPASLVGWNSASDVSFNLTGDDHKIAIVFNLPRDGTITHVGFSVASIQGSPPNYAVALETIDSNRRPSGTNYGGSDRGTFAPSATGWLWVALGTAATASAGDTVAAVIGYPATTPNTSNRIAARSTTLGATILPAREQFTTAWTSTSGLPPIAVKYSDNFVVGCPTIDLLSGANYGVNTTPDEMGARFTVPVDMTVFGFRLGHARSSSAATATGKLYDNSNNVLASIGISADVSLAVGPFDFYFDPVALIADEVYRLSIEATNTTNLSLGQINLPDADSRVAFPEGSRWQLTQRTDAGAWTDTSLRLPWLALWVSEIEMEPGGGGATGGAYAYVG